MTNQKQSSPWIVLRIILTVVDVGVVFISFAALVLIGFLSYAMLGGKGGGPFYLVMAICELSLLATAVLQWFEKWRVFAYGLGTGLWLVTCVLPLFSPNEANTSGALARGDVWVSSVIIGGILILHCVALYSAIKSSRQPLPQLVLPTCLTVVLLGILASHHVVENITDNKCFNQIQYLGADWGPNLDATNPDQADGVIYFIKEIRFSYAGKAPSSSDGPGVRLWFCKMNWDGSDKEELCELWPGQSPSGGGLWLSVSTKAREAVFSFEAGRDACSGLWQIDLDGKNLRLLAQPKEGVVGKLSYTHPSMSPDGKEVVFSAVQKDRTVETATEQKSRLGIVEVKTGTVRWLTDEIEDDCPSWSPNGDWIVYTHYYRTGPSRIPVRVWLIKPDGSENKPVMGDYDPYSNMMRTNRELFARFPAWSHDGKWIYAGDLGFWYNIIDAATGKTVLYKRAQLSSKNVQAGMGELGKKGFLLLNPSLRVALASPPQFEITQVVEPCHDGRVQVARFGDLSTYESRWGDASKEPSTR